jgi:hypothetical protein
MGPAARLAVATALAAATAPPAHAAWPGDANPCALLAAADFAAVGLKEGRAQRGNDVAGGVACTWDPVLGGGGFLTLHLQTADQYEKRQQRAKSSEPVAGLGTAAFVVKGLAGSIINVKAGERSFRIDGNARLDRARLETLAKAVLSRL